MEKGSHSKRNPSFGSRSIQGRIHIPPRYYQRNAVNRTLDAIARGQDRILLVIATGTGKTYTAFQIVYRLLKSGMKKKNIVFG